MMKQDLFYAKEKIELLLNIDDADKLKFEGLYGWCPKAMELTVKEKTCGFIPEEGEIWTCDFGVNVGSEIDKIRPGIIGSRYKNNKNSNVVSIIPITHTNHDFETHVRIEDRYLQYKEDRIDGSIKIEQERALSKSRLGRKIGKLNAEGLKAVKKAILIHHNISPEIMAEIISEYAELEKEKETITETVV